MVSSSLLLLLGAAGIVAILHSVLPDHWVPLAVVARTQRWSLWQVGRVTVLASLGHVITSLVLAGILAAVGLQFRQELETQQGRIMGIVLGLTGIIFFIWGLFGRGGHKHDHEGGHTHHFGIKHNHDAYHHHNHHSTHEHNHDTHGHNHDHNHYDHHDHDTHTHDHDHTKQNTSTPRTLMQRLAAIAVPFGVAASPDLTILPVALAASALGTGAVVSVLGTFTLLTIGTFVTLTIIATLIGYQIKGVWLEKHANTITSLMLIALGIIAFVGF